MHRRLCACQSELVIKLQAKPSAQYCGYTSVARAERLGDFTPAVMRLEVCRDDPTKEIAVASTLQMRTHAATPDVAVYVAISVSNPLITMKILVERRRIELPRAALKNAETLHADLTRGQGVWLPESPQTP